MSSILRSGKLLRYFSGITKNVILNKSRILEPNLLLKKAAPLSVSSNINYCNVATDNLIAQVDTDIEKQLRRLDNDVRRMGRISRRDLEDVLEEIRSHQSATSSQSLMIIRCCGNLVSEEMPEERTKLVEEIWKTLKAINVPMDISHYNALLRVYLENEYNFSPTDFLAELEAQSIEPNRVTYQRLIAHYCQQGDIDGATKILEIMREKNLPVNEAVFNALILGHSQANDMDSAKGILTVMKQAGLDPTADTYSTLLSCYAKHGDLDAIKTTLEECDQKDIVLIDKDILNIVYQLTINGFGDKIDSVLARLHISSNFNQECVNVILRLTNRGHEDVCLRLLKMMPRGNRPSGEPIDVGSFFIRQLIKANRPMENILNICKILLDEGLHSRPLLIATESALANRMVDSALLLFKELKRTGLPIRQHFFWPLICASKSVDVLNVLKQMQRDYDLTPTSETLRDYVIPRMVEKHWEHVMTALKDAGIPNGTAAAACCYVALINHKLEDAAVIMESYKSIYDIRIFRQPLIRAFSNTQNYTAFTRCLRQFYESEKWFKQSSEFSIEGKKPEETDEMDNELISETSDDKNLQTQDLVGEILLDVVAYFRTTKVDILEKLLPQLISQGFTISNSQATRISEKLGSEMTTIISDLLAKLSSGELELVPLENSAKRRSLDSLSIDELERFISNLDEKGENTQNVKRYLFTLCCRSRNLNKALETLKNMESSGLPITSGMNAQIIELYIQQERITDALELYNQIKAKEHNFCLDNIKTVGIAELLLKENRLDDAIKILDDNKKSSVEVENNYNYSGKVWRALNLLADRGEADQLKQFFDALVNKNYVVPTNIILGPLIKVHLVNEDMPAAINAFEEICEEYRVTPWKNELARRLIQDEDATNLQKITDLSTNIHGEINSLYDLVFSFIECGRIRQARRILETPGLQTRPHRINHACDRYISEGMTEPLEGLIEATKDLNHIDRNKIYYTLLLSYCKSNEAEKGLGLWTKMQEENLTPDDLFLAKLALLLEKNNIALPFIAPPPSVLTDMHYSNSNVGKKIAKNSKTQIGSKAAQLRQALMEDDLNTALKIHDQCKNLSQLTNYDTSLLIEKLTQNQRIAEAANLIEELLAKKSRPTARVFKYFLNTLGALGDCERIEKIGMHLNADEKRYISFDNRYCKAIVTSGKSEQYLDYLMEQIKTAKTQDEVAKLNESFPRGGALGLLENKPELISRYMEIAVEYAQHNEIGPINVLWMHYFTKGDEANSKIIWEKYLTNSPRVMFQNVLKVARQNNDEELAYRLISYLKTSKVSEKALGTAFSCLIDIQTIKGSTDKALQTLKDAINDICLENINHTALKRLKLALEAEKKEFPYTISSKKSSKSNLNTSSSSSDDDTVSKKS